MKSAPWIIISILIVLLVIQRECAPQHKCDPCPKTDTITIIKHDTLVKSDTTYVPIIRYRSKVVHDSIPVDTAAIIAAYMEMRYYNDTAVNDSSAIVVVEDSVTMNMIAWRKWHVAIHPKTVCNTTVVTKLADPLRKLYVGIGIGRSPEQFGLSPGLMYISKRETAYTINYDLINRDVYFSLWYKIKLRGE